MRKSLSPSGRTILLAVIIGLVFGLRMPRMPVVLAHANVVRSEPAENAVLDEPPSEVVIWFTEPLEPQFGRIEVLDSEGKRVDKGDSAVTSQDPAVMSVSLSPLDKGTYVVVWTNVSTVDGHKVRGSFLFSIGEPLSATSVGAGSGQPLFQSPLEPVLRWLTLLAMLAVVGGLGFELLIVQPILARLRPAKPFRKLGERLASRALKLIWAAMGLFLAGSIGQLLVQTTVTYELPLLQTLGRPLLTILLNTSWGLLLLWRLCLLLAMPAVLDLALVIPGGKEARDGQPAFLNRLSRGLTLGVGAGILLTLSLTSHAAAMTSLRAAAVFNDYLHLLAASFWVGGLFHFALGAPLLGGSLSKAKQREFLAALAPRFSILAAVSVGLLALTGLYSSWAQVTVLPALQTPYGLMLVAKLGLVVLMLALGGLNLLWVRPRLGREDAAGRWLRRLVAGEALLAVLALAVVGGLVSLEPARQVASREGLGRDLTFADTVEGTQINLTVEPGRVGPNRFLISLTDRRGKPVNNASEVSLRLAYLETDLGDETVSATPAGDGTYLAEGASLSLAGPWQAALTVRRPDALDARTAFRFEVISGGAGSAAAIAPAPQMGNLLGAAELALLGLVLLGLSLPSGRWRTRRGGAVALPGLGAALAGLLLAVNAGFVTPEAGETTVRPNSGPPAAAAAASNSQTGVRADGLAIPERNPFLPDADSLATGQRVFEQSCPACHGLTGHGDGLLAENMSPPPADLLEHIPIHPDAEMFSIIRDSKPGSPMPPFGDQWSDEEIWHLINYLKVFEADQRLADTYYNRGVTFFEEGDNERALENFNEAIQLSPNFAAAYNDRAEIHRRRGEYDLAIADHSQAIELQPNYEYAYYSRGLTYVRTGDLEQAIADYNLALELDPDYTFAYYARGLAYAEMGDLEQALADFDKTLELYAGYAGVYLDRGLAHYALGQPAPAISDLKRYLELVPEAENREAVVRLLSQLEGRASAPPEPTPPAPEAALTLAELPAGFEAIPPAELGLIPGTPVDDGAVIEGSFAFLQTGRSELVWGFTTRPSTGAEQAGAAPALTYPDELLAAFIAGMTGAENLAQQELPGLAGLGQSSVGQTVAFTSQGLPTRVDAARFRQGDIEAFIFVMYVEGDAPQASIGDLARKLDERIEQTAVSEAVP
ncbi:MAG: tetratricopeptide repeat protein [Anaerolineae bacterium]